MQNRSEAYYFGVSFIPTFDIIAAHSIIHFRSMNQFANFRCAIAFVPFRNDRLTSGSRRHKTGKQTVISQYCSLHERSSLQQRQLLASKKVEPIKCSAHIWVDCHLWLLKQQLKTIRGTQRPSVSKYDRWFSLWFKSLFSQFGVVLKTIYLRMSYGNK